MRRWYRLSLQGAASRHAEGEEQTTHAAPTLAQLQTQSPSFSGGVTAEL